MDPSRPKNVAPREWQVIRETAGNVLAIGPDPEIVNFLNALAPVLKKPVVECPDGTFHPPEHACGALVLRNIGRLDHSSQEQLLHFLSSERRARTISTSATSVIDLVHRGEFLDTLYYRLNVITLTLGAGGSLRRGR
jgi:hypothetical protein